MRALVQAIQDMFDGKNFATFERKSCAKTDGPDNRQHSRKRASKT
jgi:hypothetical protein